MWYLVIPGVFYLNQKKTERPVDQCGRRWATGVAIRYK